MGFISDLLLIGVRLICNFQLLCLHLRTFVAFIQQIYCYCQESVAGWPGASLPGAEPADDPTAVGDVRRRSGRSAGAQSTNHGDRGSHSQTARPPSGVRPPQRREAGQ